VRRGSVLGVSTGSSVRPASRAELPAGTLVVILASVK
jgi:hypothetical protein